MYIIIIRDGQMEVGKREKAGDYIPIATLSPPGRLLH